MSPRLSSLKALPLLAIGAWILLLATIFAERPVHSVWDDALMYARYADHLRAEGLVAWNDGEPAYGATSLAFLGLVLALRPWILDAGHVCLAASAVSMLALCLLLLRMATNDTGRRGTRAFAALFLVFALVPGSATLAVHAFSGMDTTFAMAWFTLYLLLTCHDTTTTRARTIAAGFLGGTMYLCRPDLCAITVGYPLLVGILAGKGDVRRRHALLLASTFVGLSASLVATFLLFGSPLPLALHAKSLSLYGPAFYEQYRGAGLGQALDFVSEQRLLLGFAILGALLPSTRSHDALRARCLAFTLGLYLVYVTFFVTQVMGMNQRFFMPALPGLAFLAMRTFHGLAARLTQPTESHPVRSSRHDGLVATALAVVLIAWFPLGTLRTTGRAMLRQGLRFPTTDTHYRERWAGNWIGLLDLRDLPDGLVVAATEVGMPGVLLPGKRVLDLAALNEPTLAWGRRTVAELVADERPDWIYMPHVFYERMIQRLVTDEAFQRDYVLYRIDREHLVPACATTPWHPLDVAIRRDGPYTARLERILQASCRVEIAALRK